jgi:hypothetical protein
VGCLRGLRDAFTDHADAELPWHSPVDRGAFLLLVLTGSAVPRNLFPGADFYVMLAAMGNKDKGRKETKKAPKPKPKPEPGRKHEVFTPAPPK